MDPSRVGVGEKIAAGSAAVLLIALFLPWYGLEVEGTKVAELTAWEGDDITDILVCLSAVVVLGVVAGKAMGALASISKPADIIVLAGIVALVLVGYRFIKLPSDITPGADVSHELGYFIGLIAVIGVCLGGYRGVEQARGSLGAEP